MKKFIPYALALTSLASPAFANAEISTQECFKKPTFIKILSKEQAEPLFKQFLKIDKKTIPETDALYGMYQADINNDKKLEDILVFQDTSGTMGALDILTLEHDNKNSKNLGPNEPDDAKDGPFYFRTYSNKMTGADEFLTQLCGTTYMVFDLGGHRDAYLWENGKTVSACDAHWMNYEKESFQTLYKNKLYGEAYEQLNFYIDKCQNKIDHAKLLWMKNDSALAIQKAGNPQKCQEILHDIKTDESFSKMSQNFQNAVAFNLKQCNSDLTAPGKLEKPKGDKEYAWLLNSKLPEKEKNALFAKLISQVAPAGLPSEHFLENFSSELATRTYPPKIEDGRYGIASSCYPHDCTFRGILWVDIHDGTSIGGFITAGGDIVLTSKFYNLNTYPLRAKQDIKKVVLDLSKEWNEDPGKKNIIVYDPEEKNTTTHPIFWLDRTSPSHTSTLKPTQYEQPITKTVTNLKPTPTAPDRNGKLTCSIYPNFAVLEVSDEGVGSNIRINYLTKDTKTDDSCKENFSGKQQPLPSSVFKGVIGHYIFLSSGDGYGGIDEMNIYDVNSGKKIFASQFNYEKTFSVQNNNGKISLTYFQPMKTVCNPSEKNPECWLQILKANHVNPGAKIAAPDCTEPLKLNPDIEKNYADGSQLIITAKVNVSDINQPNINFVGGETTCESRP